MNEFLQQVVNGIAWGSLYALIALGYTMVYGVLRLINFAHGDVYMIGAMVAYYAARALLAPGTASAPAFFALLALSMAACGLLGFLIERLAYRPLRRSPKFTALITAIGVSLLLENGGQLFFGPDPKFFPQLIESREISPGSGIVITNVQLLILGVSLTLMLGLQFLVFRTRVGTALRAVSYSAETASLMGIDVDRMISLTFVLGSMLAGAAGVLVGLSNPKIEPLMGIMPGLKAFVAAVVGGIGNIPGAMAGGLLMGLSEVLVVGYVSSTYRDAIAFVILIVVLLVRPSGLFGTSLEEKV
ncbi:MAG: branched-chain amino acid ABC transporter permease [Deltaproteobacteria bacterium]|nr:branched-chain amino acid ABC transporter permease [Deltaproteobacteria bacterium]